MVARYTDDELLPLSGVQHYAFCPRQWALIHIEQQWEENGRTVAGEILHERCHDESIREHRGDLLVVRGLRVTSYKLGLSGICDVVEFRKTPEGIKLSGEEGKWLPVPVEYKKGSSKVGDEDRIQLCAQAIALEEMFFCNLHRGYLYYGATRSREEVMLDRDLRNSTAEVARHMHDDYLRGVTPAPHPRRACQSCSLKNRCLPGLSKVTTVEAYMRKMLGDADD
jgi:CRISPR-associated exonuclease Cas4